MQCLAPITLWRKEKRMNQSGRNPSNHQVDVVPCGKCPACLARRQAGWVFRLKQEQSISETSAFLTLTYDDDNIPISENGLATLNPKHHQLFMKRLRGTIKKHFNQENSKAIRYYAVGEYGDKSLRPHYHSIIFNLPRDYIKHPELVTRDWQHGNTMTAICNGATIAYVTKYINKTLFTNKSTDPNDDRIKEFSHMSKGLGQKYLSPNVKKYYQSILSPYLVLPDGDKGTMPRYYKDKLYTDKQKQIINDKTLQFIEENPAFNSEKERVDYTNRQFEKHQFKNKINRQTL